MLPRLVHLRLILRPAGRHPARPPVILPADPAPALEPGTATGSHLDYDHRRLAAGALDHYAAASGDDRFHVH